MAKDYQAPLQNDLQDDNYETSDSGGKKPNLMEVSLGFRRLGSQEIELDSGEGGAVLNDEGLLLAPKLGDVLFYSYREIQTLSAVDYRIVLALDSGETLILDKIGYYYEDFRRVLIRMRNETLLSDLLMNEPLCFSCPEAEYRYTDETGTHHGGRCEARIYQTGIVILPESGELLRIPFGEFAAVSAGDYRIVIKTEYREEVAIYQMGRVYDPFHKALGAAIEGLSAKVRGLLTDLFPEASPAAIRSLTPLMKEGKAVSQSGLETILPGAWKTLEDRLKGAGLEDSLQYLASLTKCELYAGVKRGLMGDLTGEYLWFLIPIYHNDPRQPGNAIAMEAAAGDGSGKATYFFRIKPRKVYAQGLKIDEELNEDIHILVKQLNRAMLAVNFRREPIYLPEERLKEAANLRYKTAVQKLPSLQLLRDLYIGRVIHTNPEQWRNNVLDLLRFNVATINDGEKWRKGQS